MTGHVSKQHASKAPFCPPETEVWYLPHHTNAKKQKLRMVFDCVALCEERSLTMNYCKAQI